MFHKGWAVRPCNENIMETLALADRMIRLSEKGDVEREDTGCGILYGILRDSAYKIRNLAQVEKHAHKKKGWWQTDD